MSAPDAATRSRRLGSASLLSLASQIIGVAAMLMTTPRLVRGLGDSGYGVLALVASFTSYFAYLEMGIGSAYVRELTMAFTRGQDERAQQLYETAHVIYSRVAWAGAIGMVALGVPYTRATLADPSLFAAAVGGLVATAVVFLVTMLLSTSRAVVFADQRADLHAWVSFVLQPVIPLAQILVVRLGGGVLGVISVLGAGTILTDVIMWILARRLRPGLILRRRWNPAVWADLRGFSFHKFVGQMAMQGQLAGDRMLVGSLRSPAELAPYAIASSISQRLRLLGSVVAWPLSTAMVDAFAREGAAAIAPPLLTYVQRVAVLGALSAAGGTFMARPFLASWVGPGFAAAGAPILQVALLSSLCLTLSALLTYATDAINRPEAGARSSVVMVILSVAATLPLLWWLGPVGAAWGFMLGSAVQLVWLWIVLARVLDPRDARRLVRVGALQPLALFLVAYAVMRLAPALVAPAWQQVPALAVWLAAVLWALRRAGSWQRFMLLGVALPLALFHLACEAHRALPLLPPLPGPFWRDLPSSIVGGVVGLALAAALGAHRSVARAA